MGKVPRFGPACSLFNVVDPSRQMALVTPAFFRSFPPVFTVPCPEVVDQSVTRRGCNKLSRVHFTP
jgi:hypothetical protein